MLLSNADDRPKLTGNRNRFQTVRERERGRERKRERERDSLDKTGVRRQETGKRRERERERESECMCMREIDQCLILVDSASVHGFTGGSRLRRR
jgi:hypothetical protein